MRPPTRGSWPASAAPPGPFPATWASRSSAPPRPGPGPGWGVSDRVPLRFGRPPACLAGLPPTRGLAGPRQPHVAGPMRTQILTGLESWFTLPTQPGVPPPPYKVALVTWATIFPLITLVVVATAPLLGSLPLVLRLAVTTGVTVPLLTSVVMPRVTRLVGRWLYPTSPRPLRIRSRGPSSTVWRPGRRTSFPIPCRRRWPTAGATGWPRRSSARTRRSHQHSPSLHKQRKGVVPGSSQTYRLRNALEEGGKRR